MPAPTNRSRLVHRLASATGLTTARCYQLLNEASEPSNAVLRDLWRKALVDAQAGEDSEIQADDSGACPHGMPPLGAGVHPVGAR